ncbi:MAG: tRNA (cytidine(34)-2'-O)-methyltransferase [bacterium]|nr:tRNA (cytidine(34)-2'-O)-methyltransferase [bacterium]
MSVSQPRERITTLADVADAPLHLVLVEPAIPPNTGNVSRLCAATGCALHLVGPLGFSVDDRALKRAGLDYWEHVRLVLHASLREFLEKTERERLWLFAPHARRRYDRVAYRRGDMLVFGTEVTGLPQALLDAMPERCLRIPMRPRSVRTINLSTSVGIAAFEALRALDFPGLE